ncbi:hypothetical protein P280DRAFT_278292 [Massarina eburnea CBS 473.64]|uniref:Uncharacterized protein n=1 Tax=Massarina eburnea CBS 473.64 TaxID=1395130 RepID=A0A6A6RG80_9PLEO|nr:hypothetical protein P280DRAFT_278292 [Massarina eburnea CBS 473.64]
MAEPTSSHIGGTPPHFLSDDHLGSGTPKRADILLSFITYKDFYDDLETQPEADVRHRFLRARSKRAAYVERLVRGCDRALEDFQSEVENGNIRQKEEDLERSFEIKILNLDKALRWYSQINEDDSKAACAPVVDQYFMEHTVRFYTNKPEKGLRGPNAELRASYGSVGDPVPISISAVRGCESDPVRRLILDKLTEPFYWKVYAPIRDWCKTAMGDETKSPKPKLEGGILQAIGIAVEFSVAAGCFAGSMTLLYNLKSTKARLITAPFMSLVCALPVVFMSRDARQWVMLMAG